MPSGWHYMQPTSSGTIRLNSDSYDELLLKVGEWRVTHDLPVGNVQGDVDQFICETYPLQCYKELKGGVGPAIPRGQNFVDFINAWLSSMLNKVHELTDEKTANLRAGICIQCPYNQSFEGSCGKCSSNAKRASMILRQKKDVANVNSLKGCQLLKQDNRAAVWLDNYKINNKSLPDYCWAKERGNE